MTLLKMIMMIWMTMKSFHFNNNQANLWFKKNKICYKLLGGVKLMRAKPVTEFKRRKRRPKVKFKVEDINYKNVEY